MCGESTLTYDVRTKPLQRYVEHLSDLLPSLQVPQDAVVVTSVHCNVHFLKQQHEALKAFVPAPLVFLVFSDLDYNKRVERVYIREYCEREGLHYFPFPVALHSQRRILFPTSQLDSVSIHNASTRCSNVFQCAYQVVRQHRGFVLMLDADCMPFAPVNVPRILGPCALSARQNGSEPATYPWLALVVMDMGRLPDQDYLSWDLGAVSVDGTAIRVDAGGFSHYWLRRHPQAFRDIGESNDPSQQQGVDVQVLRAALAGAEDQHLDWLGQFLHFRAGSNWRNEPLDSLHRKIEAFRVFIQGRIEHPTVINGATTIP
jgi:hypothetical protein